MTQKIIKTGNSAAVTIPVEFFDALGLRYGDRVEAKMDYRRGTVTFKFLNGRQLPLGKEARPSNFRQAKVSRVKSTKKKDKK